MPPPITKIKKSLLLVAAAFLIILATSLLRRGADTGDAALEILKEPEYGIMAGAFALGTQNSLQRSSAIDYFESKGINISLDYWILQTQAEGDPEVWVSWAERRKSKFLPELIQSWHRQSPAAAKAWLNRHYTQNDPEWQEIMRLINP